VDLNSPELWRWIWFAAALIFLSGEVITPATFFFLPFALGAVVAGTSALFGLPLGLEWVLFSVVSIAVFAGLWPLGRRLERSDAQQEGVGATRWVGQEAKVLEDISENGNGTVRLEREIWRAESLTGAPVKRGSTVVVTRLAGTRLIVVPIDEPLEDLSSTNLNAGGGETQPTQGAQ